MNRSNDKPEGLTSGQALVNLQSNYVTDSPLGQGLLKGLKEAVEFEAGNMDLKTTTLEKIEAGATKIKEQGLRRPEKLISLAEHNRLAEQDKTVKLTDVPNKPIDAKQFSKTAVKRLLQMNKHQLVQMISNLSNYAEAQKAANIMLAGAIEQLKKQRALELESMSVMPGEQTEQPIVPKESTK